MRRSHRLFLALVLSLVLSQSPTLAAAERWNALVDGALEADGALRVELIEASAEHTVLELSLRGYWSEEASLSERSYTSLSLGDGRITEVGEPALPLVSRFLAVPLGSQLDDLKVEVLSEERRTLPGLVVPPAQRSPKRCAGQSSPRFVCNEARYRGTESFPESSVDIAGLGTMRDFRYAQLVVYPMRFDPARKAVSVATHLRVRVSHPAGPFLASPRISSSFHKLYRRLLLNWAVVEAVPLAEQPSPARERIEILAPEVYRSVLDPFVAWKRQVGYAVELSALEGIGSSHAEVLAWLQARYNDPLSRPTHVILVGDIDAMPTMHGLGGCASDFMYSLLAGDDLMSDVLVSRLSVTDGVDLALQIRKILSYESELPADPSSDWLASSVCISSSEGSGASNDDVRSDIICDLQSGAGYALVSKLYNSLGNDTASNISDAINGGRGWVTYLGHGSGLDWSTTSPAYATSHIDALMNTDRLVTVMDVSCSNGGFDVYGSCFAESWMRATSDGEPAGAVAIYSSSTPTAWDESAEMAVGLTEAFVQDGVDHWGALAFAGRAYLQQIMGTGSGVEETLQQYVVFGDSSLSLRSRAPRELALDGPAVVPVSELELSFVVTWGDGTPVPNARVHLTKQAELDLVATTDAGGQANVQISPDSPGQIHVTVTAFDAAVLHGTVDVVVTGCGVLKTSTEVLPCAGALAVTLWDQDLDLDPGSLDSASLSVRSGTDEAELSLIEAEASAGRFDGSCDPASLALTLVHGQALELSYDDVDCDGAPVSVTELVAVDCVAPQIAGLMVDELEATRALVRWETDEVARGTLFFGVEGALVEMMAPGAGLAQAVLVDGLTPETVYAFRVEATDLAGNQSDSGDALGVTTPPCEPDCLGKVCGDDACGGSCGSCDLDQECNSNGLCFGGPGCEELAQAGCGSCACEACVCAMDPYCCQSAWDVTCVGECMDACGGCGVCEPSCEGEVEAKICGADGCGGSCGACPGAAPYCTALGQCSAVCEPACATSADGPLSCGDDGCGGSCGTCAQDEICVSGLCAPGATACDAHDGPGCGACACEACVCAMDAFCCDSSWDEQCKSECTSYCGGCGPSCDPDCSSADGASKQCGDDGCGGSCGACTEPQEVCEFGQCVCVPSCQTASGALAVCGRDGCGGSCGECPTGLSCDEGACICAPDCVDVSGDNIACGDDGCGGSCGACLNDCSGEVDAGLCTEGICAPACCPLCVNEVGAALVCGDDGCGGVCGACAARETCLAGACVLATPEADVRDESADEVDSDDATGAGNGKALARGGDGGCSLARVGGPSQARASAPRSWITLVLLVTLATRLFRPSRRARTRP